MSEKCHWRKVFAWKANSLNAHDVQPIRSQKEKFLLYRIRTASDRRAFTQLHDQLAPSVFRYLRSKLPTKEDAEDALSTTFLQLWNYIQTTTVESVSGLVYTIARSVIAAFYKKRDPFTASLDESSDEGGSSTELASDEGRTARQVVAKSEIELVKEVLKEFGEEAELVFFLRYFEGLPINEVAQRTQRSVGSATMILHRIRKRLQERFENT